MIKRIKDFFKKKPTDEQRVIGMLFESQKNSNTHLIAIARLLFIKPEQLAREAKNNKANGEYLLRMAEIIAKDNKKN